MCVWIGALLGLLGWGTRVEESSGGVVVGCAAFVEVRDANPIQIRNRSLCETRRMGYEDRAREVPVLVLGVD